MSDGWALAVIFAGLFGWVVYLDVRHRSHERLARWWLSRTEEWGAAAGPCSFVISTAVLAGYSGLAWLGDLLTARAGLGWGLVITVPAVLAYAPFVFATMPGQVSGYSFWRSELQDVGAPAREQRRISWWAGPPSFLGFMAIFVTLWTILGN